MYTDIATEQEAAIGLLLCSGTDDTVSLSQAQIETISRILVLCTKFRDHDINEAFKKVFPIAIETKNTVKIATMAMEMLLILLAGTGIGKCLNAKAVRPFGYD